MYEEMPGLNSKLMAHEQRKLSACRSRF